MCFAFSSSSLLIALWMCVYAALSLLLLLDSVCVPPEGILWRACIIEERGHLAAAEEEKALLLLLTVTMSMLMLLMLMLTHKRAAAQRRGQRMLCVYFCCAPWRDCMNFSQRPRGFHLLLNYPKRAPRRERGAMMARPNCHPPMHLRRRGKRVLRRQKQGHVCGL